MTSIIEAPGGVSKLRDLILNLAVRGRLVNQDSTEEPAERLVQRISTERDGRAVQRPNRRLAAKKETLSQGLPDLPSGWESCLFEEILSLEYGQNLPKAMRSQSDVYPVYGSNGVVGSHDARNVDGPCIVVGRKGSAGALNLCKTDGCWVTDVAYFCRPSAELSLDYMYLVFKSLGLDGLSKGIKPGLSRSDVLPLVLAIPPRGEQERIVHKVDELMAFCDQLESKQVQAVELHTRIVAIILSRLTEAGDYKTFLQRWTDLAESFDVLFATEESIELLEDTIHLLAVTGRLVTQDPSDQTATDLMNELREDRLQWLEANKSVDAECRRMLTKLRSLGDATLPFELPSSWAAVHLLDVCRALADCNHKTPPYTSDGVPLIRTSNIRHGRFRMQGLKFVSKETHEMWSKRCPPTSGDIMFTREAPIGEAAIIPDGAEFCMGQRIMLVRPMHQFISNEYLLLVLTDAALLKRTTPVGTTVHHLRAGDVERLPVPIPPLAEQRRIVARVAELMSLCGELKARFNKVDRCRSDFADAVVDGLKRSADDLQLQLAG